MPLEADIEPAELEGLSAQLYRRHPTGLQLLAKIGLSRIKDKGPVITT